MNPSLKIKPYDPSHKDDFFKINEEWISTMFTMEQIDIDILSDPEKHILSDGGQIWFAHHNKLGVVGTCALRNMGQKTFELTKMGVLEKARGLKVGEQLLQHVIQYVKKSDIELCFLLTNKKCEAAIYLYEKNGFHHDQEIMDKFAQSYKRCDVAMKLV